MYRIALCDDEPVFLKFLHKTVLNVCKRGSIPCDVIPFSSAKDLLYAVLTEKRPFDMFLLDVLMDELNGVALAKKVREMVSDATIVFITSTTEYAVRGYEVRAARYLLKPFEITALERLIEEDYTGRFLAKYITLEFDKHIERLSVEDIIAIETVGRRVAILLINKTLSYSGKLTEVLALLPESLFIRIHQSYAVNLRHLKAIDRQFAITTGNHVLPISRSQLKAVQTVFLSHMTK